MFPRWIAQNEDTKLWLWREPFAMMMMKEGVLQFAISPLYPTKSTGLLSRYFIVNKSTLDLGHYHQHLQYILQMTAFPYICMSKAKYLYRYSAPTMWC